MSKWYFVTNYSVTDPDGYADYPKLVGAIPFTPVTGPRLLGGALVVVGMLLVQRA